MAARARQGGSPTAAPQVTPTSAAGAGRPTGTGTGETGGRATSRGPAAGIGAPIYEELVRELGDPAA